MEFPIGWNFLFVDTIRRVAARLETGASLVAPSYAGERGHPVGFAGRFGPALLALTGDAGARDLLRAEAGALEILDLDDPGVVRDVDTPADPAG
jgi:molybdenum cofactor cytidylyltransferase